MHYITRTKINSKTSPKQSHSIDPITTRKNHQTNTKFTTTTLNRHQTNTKPTPNQHYITQVEVNLKRNPKENLKQPNPNCKAIKKHPQTNRTEP